MFVGKVVDCPACRARLEIVADGPKKLSARPVDEPSSLATPDATRADHPPKKRKRRRKPKAAGPSAVAARPSGWFVQRLTAAMKNPVVVAWIAAGVATASLVGAALSRSGNHDENTVSVTTDEPTEQQPPRIVNDGLKTVASPDQPVAALKPVVLPTIPKNTNPPIIVRQSPTNGDRSVAVARKPLLESVKRIDIAAALAQKILRFEQAKGTPLKTLLLEIEELAGVPVTVDPAVASLTTSPLSQPVVIMIERATVGQILAALLSKSGLTYTADADRIRIIPATARPRTED